MRLNFLQPKRCYTTLLRNFITGILSLNFRTFVKHFHIIYVHVSKIKPASFLYSLPSSQVIPLHPSSHSRDIVYKTFSRTKEKKNKFKCTNSQDDCLPRQPLTALSAYTLNPPLYSALTSLHIQFNFKNDAPSSSSGHLLPLLSGSFPFSLFLPVPHDHRERDARQIRSSALDLFSR